LEECATWDGGNSTWGGQGVGFGTILVWCRCTGECVGDGLFLAGRVVKGILFRTYPKAVRDRVDQSCVKKFFDFFLDDVMNFWIDPPLTLHLWNAYSRWGGNSLSSTTSGCSSSEDWLFFGSTTLRSL
nr:hypothetical protein [Tanacetum cinerariifolium]